MRNPEEYFSTDAEKRMARAVAKGDSAEAMRLLSTGAVRPDAQGDENIGWLAIAIIAGRKDIFDALLARGALGDPAGPLAGQAMYYATVDEDDRWLIALHRAGASLNNIGAGERLLAVAAGVNMPERLRFYIDHGADLEAPTMWMETTAVTSAKADNYDSLLMLLKAGASPWAVSPKGHSIGFWLERKAQNPLWDFSSEHEQKRRKIIALLQAAGVPHPPPPPAEVLRLIEARKWGPRHEGD